MKLLLRGVHMGVGDRLRAYVEEHLGAAIAHLHDGSAVEMDVALVDVNGPKGGEDKACRVTFRSPHIRTLRVEERGADIYACIAGVRDRLVRLVNRELDQLRQVDRLEIRERRRTPEGEEVLPPMELPQT